MSRLIMVDPVITLIVEDVVFSVREAEGSIQEHLCGARLHVRLHALSYSYTTCVYKNLEIRRSGGLLPAKLLVQR